MTAIEGSGSGDHIAGPDDVPALPRWPDRITTASAAAAWLSMAMILIGLVVATVPVRNPRVQDCGAPLAFALTGRVDVYADPDHPPHGFTPEQAASANHNRCQKRVASRLVPAGVVVIGGVLGGLGGLAMLLVGRRGRRRAIMGLQAPLTPTAGPWASPSDGLGVPATARSGPDPDAFPDQALAPEPPP